MDNSHMFSGKFITPKLPDIRIPRHTLLNMFHQSANKRVIIVSAPAGYGKTVSTLLWLNSSERETIWITLDKYDNTLPVFYKLLCTGLLSTQPENQVLTNILKSPTFASSPVEHAISFMSEFLPADKLFALVFDDTHNITNEEIWKSALFFEKRMPSSFITLILTRDEVPQTYISAIGEDNCSLITTRNLAFSDKEIQHYFKENGRSITMEDAAAIHAVTNGWAISVKALAASGRIELVKSSGQILEDYIKTHIWGEWDDELRNFMLQTSVVDIISFDLADKLTGRTDSREIFEKLYAKNSFVSHVDKDTFCYHPLFLDFLRNNQGQNDKVSKNTLYKKVSDYYLENGEIFLAAQYAIKCGDPDSILNSFTFINIAENGSVHDYVNLYKNFLKEPIPESICARHPFIYLTYVWYYFLIGDAPKMEYYLDRVYEYLSVITEVYPRFSELATMSTSLDHRVSLSEQIERLTSISDIADLSGQLHISSISMHLPYAHRTLRDYSVLARNGMLARFEATLGAVLKMEYSSLIFVLQSALLYEKNMLGEALRTVRQMRDVINEYTKEEAVFCSFIHLAAIYSAMGNEKLFADTMEQTQQYIEKNGFLYLRPNFKAFKTKMLLMDGNKTAAREWLDNYFVIETEQMALYKVFQHFTTARAYIVLAQTDKAMSYILKLKKLGTDFCRPLDIAEASALQAILEWTLGRKHEALDTLESALIAMQEYGFIRIFADEGVSILPILKKLALKLKKGIYQTTLSAKFLNEVTIAAYEQAQRHGGISMNIYPQKPTRLSKQQRHIITLLSKGYKNAEIAEITGLTIHTVKSHCAAAYAKLDVNNSMDAVLKAKEMNLID